MKQFGIYEKVIEEIKDSDFDALIIGGSDNIQYLSGAFVPFSQARRGQKMLLFWPRDDDPILYCPSEWESTIRKTSWINQIIPYMAGSDRFGDLVGSLCAEISDLEPEEKKIGVDNNKIQHGILVALKKNAGKVDWIGCDAWLNGLRMIKTGQEIEWLENLALDTDHGINGAIHHVTIDRYQTALTLAEEIRVHTTERGLDLVGYHAASHVAAGMDTHRIWPMPPVFGYSKTRAFIEGDLVRMRMQGCRSGYWSDATRIMTAGEPTEEQSLHYDQWMQVRNWIVENLVPGKAVNEIYQQVVEKAQLAGIPLTADLPLGHGVGVSPEEPPYITAHDDTILKTNMVLIVCPVIHPEEGPYIWMKDTFVITKTGSRLVGWYKDWREPYIPIASI